jgi:hypothetical protein
MQAFLLPQWLIKHIERTKRAFFWRGKKKCLGGHCLVNWNKINTGIQHEHNCFPKVIAKLGIVNVWLPFGTFGRKEIDGSFNQRSYRFKESSISFRVMHIHGRKMGSG